MGILNITPDSFSDGGLYSNRAKAVERAIAMARDGADIIDIGGESTRPGAREIECAEELDRVIPVIERIVKVVDLPISIDTRRSRVAAAAVKAGARIINDVSGLKYDPHMADAVAESGATVILMHMRGTPSNMQTKTRYRDVVVDVINELRDSIRIAKRSGILDKNFMVDPGIGFAKTTEQNLQILNRLPELKDALRLPICIGTSRKSFIRDIVGCANTAAILAGTVATCSIAVLHGADIVRVHDIIEAKAAVAIAMRIAAAQCDHSERNERIAR